MEIIKSSSPFYRNISLNYNASIKLYRIPKGLHNRNELQFWFQILLFMQKGKKSDLCLVMHHLCTLLASTTEDTQLSLHIHLIIFFFASFHNQCITAGDPVYLHRRRDCFHTHLSLSCCEAGVDSNGFASGWQACQIHQVPHHWWATQG